MEADDELFLYTTELLTLALIWHDYHDAIKEGDGDRVLRIWKFLLVIFKKTGRKNYSKEAFLLLLNYHFFFSEGLAAQLKWSRFINTQGMPGCNIPCDLHMEHLNRQLKGSLRNLRSNVESGPITRAGKAVGIVHSVGRQFGEEVGISMDSGRHRSPVFDKDLDHILPVLQQVDPFILKHSRKITSIRFKKPLLDAMDKDGKIVEWMVEKTASLVI